MWVVQSPEGRYVLFNKKVEFQKKSPEGDDTLLTHRTLRKFSHEEVKKAHSHVWALRWKSLSILADGCQLISQIKDAPVTLHTILNIIELICLPNEMSLPQHSAKISVRIE